MELVTDPALRSEHVRKIGTAELLAGLFAWLLTGVEVLVRSEAGDTSSEELQADGDGQYPDIIKRASRYSCRRCGWLQQMVSTPARTRRS